MNRTAQRSEWFLRFGSGVQPEQRLFCFPYAGGNAGVFRNWQQALPSSIEVIGIQAPGQGSRMLEPACDSINEIVDRLLPEIAPLLHTVPYSLFGHSNGALTAFEFTRLIQAKGYPMPDHLILSGSSAPWSEVNTDVKDYNSMSEKQFLKELESLNGTPASVLAHKELLNLMMPGLRASFALRTTYQFKAGALIKARSTILYGSDDGIKLENITAWQQYIDGKVSFREIKGGHFFIHSQEAVVTKLLREMLLKSRY